MGTLDSLFLTPEAYVALYLGMAAKFRALAMAEPDRRDHFLALGREAVTYARRMMQEAY